MARHLETATTALEQPHRAPEVRDGVDEIPRVCFIEDICRILRMSRRSVERLRRHGAFPIAELPALDKRPRWSGDAVQRWLSEGRQVGRSAWRRRVV